jgi:glycosyltransferase involved in cell wall biosynthesis
VTLGGLAAWRLAGAVTVAARRTACPLRSPARYQWLCDRLFCVSRYAAELCAQAGFPPDRLVVVHDGVDPDRVRSGDRGRGRATLGLGDHETMLLHVGSLNACKGHRFLLDAMPTVLNRRPEAQLVLAGAGELEAPLREQAGRLNVRHRVRFLGFRHDVPDLIHACDLFVFPSICEGLGSTLIDVMLARRPIVTTLAGGIPDVVGQTGDSPRRVAWIAPPGQADELGKTIVHALEATEENAAMVERAKVRAESLFTVDRMVEATLAGARAALSGRGN